MLAGAVDALERLLMLQAHQAVVACQQTHLLHGEQVLVDGAVSVAVHGRKLMLGRGHLVMLGLGCDGEAPQHVVELLHEGVHRRADGAEVMLVKLLALAGRRAEQRASRHDEVLALLVHLLGDEEVFLLVADVDRDGLGVFSEQGQHALGLHVKSGHGAQQRGLLVQSLASVGAEGRGDAQHLVFDEGRGRGIPCGIAAGLERGTQTAVRETGCVGLALDEFLAGELRNGRAVMQGLDERVMLLGGNARQRLEPVREMRGALRHRPFLHGMGNRIGDVQVEGLALLDGVAELLVDVGRQVLFHDTVGKDHGTVAIGQALCHGLLPSR